ncbi:MAG: NmrA family NAD(P)-binding protein [Thermoguttaceae bacterium]
MKIAITTPTGHVGSAVADLLLEQGGDIEVKLLGRRPHALASLVRRGAETAIGLQDDAEYLGKALCDVDALFWVTPPGYGSDNVRGFQNRLGKAAAEAVQKCKLHRVVNLSSIGAQFDSGVGPICGLHDVENHLKAADNITHLRPGFFFENLLQQIDGLRADGRFSFPLSGTRRFVMLATRDVAQVAVQWLTDITWHGRQVRELRGPADLSFNDVARILSESLGRKITYARCQPQQMRAVIVSHGLSENMADIVVEMYDAIENGRLKPEQADRADNRTSTTLADFARETMLPLMSEKVAN